MTGGSPGGPASPGGQGSPAATRALLADLRRVRRRRRIEEFDVGEAVYKAYVAAIVGGISIWFATGLVGGSREAPGAVAHILLRGPAVVGAAVAVVWVIGLRSGARGGPLALESAFVRHVLLAPVDRPTALRSSAWRLLRFATTAGAGAGIVVGLLAYRRLGDGWAAWAACGALCGALTAGSGLGAAMVTGGLRVGRAGSAVVAVLVAGWSVADVATSSATSPASLLGEAAFWPLRFAPTGLIGVAVAAVLVASGLILVGGTSIEASARRASLVGLLRFAVTVRDLRTVVLLRRQLAQELPRRSPWVKLGFSVKGRRRSGRIKVGVVADRWAPGAAGWVRAWRSILRFPLGRIVRMALLGVAAGAAAYGAWKGTTPLVLAAGLAMFVAGLDATEPLAQAVDHPWATDSYPHPRGAVMLGLLPACAVAMAAIASLGALCAWALAGGGLRAFEIAVIVWLPASLAGLAGATISTVQGAQPTFRDSDLMFPPEFLGARVGVRLLWPPLVATAGVLPVLAARSAAANPVGAAASASVVVTLVLAGVAVWVRHQESWHKAIAESLDAVKLGGTSR